MKMDISDEGWEGLQETINELAEKAYPRSDTQKLCQYVFRKPLIAIGNPLWLIGRWRSMNFCQQKPKKLESIIEIR
jgi:hypothetical protein